MNLVTHSSSTLRAFIISPSDKLASQLESSCAELDCLRIVRNIRHYPPHDELTRLARIYLPHVVFLSVESLPATGELLHSLRAEIPGVHVVGIHQTCEPALLLQLMRLGIQEFLHAPFTKQATLECAARINAELNARPLAFTGTDLVYSFLPSKPGVGTTTLALNAAISIAAISDQKTFLGDFDMNCGLIRFMLKLSNTYSVLDATEHTANIDENLWPQLVTGIDSLDVLHAGTPKPQHRMDLGQLRHLLEFLRRYYRIVISDLSGNLEKFSIEIMHESKRIFLVTTAELPALHLAREKYLFLESLDLADRVTLLLNRSGKDSLLAPKEIEQIVGIPVYMGFPNDYRSVHAALSVGARIRPESALGRQCAALAQFMLTGKMKAPPERRRRFVEYFSLVPANYRFERS